MVQHIMREQEFGSDVFDRGTWQKVLQLLQEHKKVVAPLIFFNTTLAVTDVIVSLLDRYTLNTYVDDQTGADALPVFVLIYVGMISVQCLLVYLFFRLTVRVESDFGKNPREKCFRKPQEQAFSYFNRTVSGWLMIRITSDTTCLAETLAWASIGVVWGAFVILEISVVMLFVNWQMVLCALVVVPLLWFVSLHSHCYILSARRQSRRANSRIITSFTEGINGAKTTKTLGTEQQNYDEFQKKTDDMRRYSVRVLRINAIFQPIVYLLSAVAIALLLCMSREQVLSRTIQFGTLAMLINHAQPPFDLLRQAARVLAGIQMVQASTKRVVALLEEEIEITDYLDATECYGTLLKGHTDAYESLYEDVVFDHVNFYYCENEPILRDFCLQAKEGQTVALAGETGSGKNTIVNLLYHFYKPCSGYIPTDGKNLRERSVGWLHSHIGYVLQTPNLFSSVTRDNTRYGRRDANNKEVEQAARLIQAHDLISRMGRGYDTEVGEGGDRLSIGQRQLISSVRAMLYDPAIVILDEVTSSIDTESEEVIQYVMNQLLHGHIDFMVAHRLSTIVLADITVVLQHEVIIKREAHRELMAKQGCYYELFTSQYRQERIRRCMERYLYEIGADQISLPADTDHCNG